MAREKIDYLKIGFSDQESFGWARTKAGNLYMMWWALAWPEDMTATNHVRNSQWVNIIRDAMVNDFDVEFLTDSRYSNKVVKIKIYAP